MSNIKIIFLFMGIVIMFFVTGCVETRFKEIQTDANGSAEGTFVITQDAIFTLQNYICSKNDCNSSVNITIERWDKERVRDVMAFVKNGEVSPETMTTKAKFGDKVLFKVNSGCSNAKYTINFTLDSGVQ